MSYIFVTKNKDSKINKPKTITNLILPENNIYTIHDGQLNNITIQQPQSTSVMTVPLEI
jgi:hypothetical protein